VRRGWLVAPLALVCGAVACSASYDTSPADGGSDSGNVEAGPVDTGADTVSDTGGGVHDGGGDTGAADTFVQDTGPADTGTVNNDSGEAGSPYDGTTGKGCSTNAECRPGGGPGVNVCSGAGAFAAGPLYPTPVCLLPTCNPGTDGLIHYCDGPDAPTSPGVCVPSGDVGQSGTGICLPRCTFGSQGQSPTGCQGQDTCNLYGWSVDLTNTVTGIGFCFGGCATNADCATGSVCQKDQGVCLTAGVTRTKAVGAACTQADLVSGACDCFFDTATSNGYCSQFCIVGSATVLCPSGYACSGQEPVSVNGANDAAVTGFTLQNQGLAGWCLQQCVGTPCTGSTCSSAYSAGKVCEP
jgi:hypothetical protein